MSEEGEALQPADPGEEELADRLAQLLDRISQRMRPELLEGWSESELTMHQFRGLLALRRNSMRISDLASLLGIRLSSATSVIDRLALKGLVERVHDQEDRRAVLCRLTPLGAVEAESLWRIDRAWLSRVAETLTVEELRTTVRAFQMFTSAVARHEAHETERQHR